MPASFVLFGRSPRLTRAALDEAEAEQVEIISMLRDVGAHDLADRLLRCQQARLARRGSATTTWPWRCGGVGCWACRRTAMRRWWAGICHWAADAGFPFTLIHLSSPSENHEPVLRAARFRRRLRDARDKAARRDARLAHVAFAGMVCGDASALVLAQHPSIAQRRIVEMVCGGGQGSMVGTADLLSPTWAMSPEHVVQLAMARRGIEPLRVVVMPQRTTQTAVIGCGEMPPLPILISAAQHDLGLSGCERPR